MNEEPLILLNNSDHDLRIDKFLADKLEKVSRSSVQKIINQGGVFIEGVPVIKKSEIIPPGTEVEVIIPPVKEATILAENIPLDVIFENQDLIVVNKPPGMVVHPSPGHSSGTLVNAVLGHAPEIEGVGGIKRPGLVHRLDQDTSGVIILAKNDPTHLFLQEQFRLRQVGKNYIALVDGRPPTPKGRIEVAIGRDPKYRQRMAPVLDREGKEAISEYITLQEFPQHTLIKVSIHTGRTHQIRVHLGFLGCPVAGDDVYGKKRTTLSSLNRQFLHAHQLIILIPGETKSRTFTAPPTSDLEAVLNVISEGKSGEIKYD
jgi:23S rRNA pseudouridine1911/1915/1917 synthase